MSLKKWRLSLRNCEQAVCFDPHFFSVQLNGEPADKVFAVCTMAEGSRTQGAHFKLEIYLVKFLGKDKISFFFLLGPPLEKNSSSAPDHGAGNAKDFSLFRDSFVQF